MRIKRSVCPMIKQTIKQMGMPPYGVDGLSQNQPENCDKANRISTDGNNPSEPKFKVGDHVRVISADKYGEGGYIVKVDEEEAGFYYTIAGIEDWRFFEPNLEPYTEPKKESRNLSQETAYCDKWLDNILKDSFRNERRLNIAAMAMQGILSNPQLLKIAIETYQEEIGSPDIYVAVAKTAKEQADALIAECEQTEKLKEN